MKSKFRSLMYDRKDNVVRAREDYDRILYLRSSKVDENNMMQVGRELAYLEGRSITPKWSFLFSITPDRDLRDNLLEKGSGYFCCRQTGTLKELSYTRVGGRF